MSTTRGHLITLTLTNGETEQGLPYINIKSYLILNRAYLSSTPCSSSTDPLRAADPLLKTSDLKHHSVFQFVFSSPVTPPHTVFHVVKDGGQTLDTPSCDCLIFLMLT